MDHHLAAYPPSVVIRDGLAYVLYMLPERHLRILCRQPFTVDGIPYDASQAAAERAVCRRPMIELIDDAIDAADDTDDGERIAWMFPSTPPTDTELDAFVNDGRTPRMPPLKGHPDHGNQTSRQ